MNSYPSPHINTEKSTIEFFLHSDCLPQQSDYVSKVDVTGISQVSLSGTFNNWAQDVLFMIPDEDGGWKIEIPLLPKGKYQYKFFVDDKMWMEDVENPDREPDGVQGFRSVLIVKE
jgi:1,4-alpha-glucan branching enzyme